MGGLGSEVFGWFVVAAKVVGLAALAYLALSEALRYRRRLREPPEGSEEEDAAERRAGPSVSPEGRERKSEETKPPAGGDEAEDRGTRPDHRGCP